MVTVIILKIGLKLTRVSNKLIKVAMTIKKLTKSNGSSRNDSLEASCPQNEKLPNTVMNNDTNSVMIGVEKSRAM